MDSIQSKEDPCIRMMVNILIFSYARKVREEIVTLTQKHCYGCRTNHGSQRKHSCLMMSEVENLNIYFDDAVDKIDFQDVLNLWKSDIQLLDISETLKHKIETLLQSDDWRETNLPSKDKFYETVKKTMQLDYRFY